ncbi:TPA: hypothetical protein N0F65_007762 [Lagenidium giganteum]|uniref:Uncharacterized protein n=1 Tax=Lagenidium giganteum TaxID=4803 RepID=A0AAV2YJV2_9STRA|nr:TPA: hypothetical protein N0F65_007762 [Lagenidium giganteum]
MTTKGKSQTTRKRKNDGPPRDLAAKKKHVRELAQAQRWHEIERVYGPKMVERAKQYAEKARGVPAQPPQTPQSLARAILEKNGYTEPPVAEAETVAVVVTPSPEKLNEEQKQQIERKRQEAIARRQQRLQQQRQQQQMYRVQSPQPDNVPVNKHRQPRQTLLTDYTSGRKAGCPQAKRGLVTLALSDEYLRNELEAAAAVVEWEDKQQSATEPPNQSCNKVMPPELQADLDAATEIVMWEASQASREFGKNLSSDVLLRQERSQRRMSELDRSQLIEQEVAAAAEALEWEKQLLSATNERSAWSNQPAVAPTVPIEVSDDEKQPTTKHKTNDRLMHDGKHNETTLQTTPLISQSRTCGSEKAMLKQYRHQKSNRLYK